MSRRANAWLRAPVLHFLVGGGALFCLVHGSAPRLGAGGAVRAQPVVLTEADVAGLRRDYARDTGMEPTAADEVALVERALDEELLFREAIARGLDRRDRSVRNWLVQQMAVLAPEEEGDADALYARARGLGLDRSDMVVRRIVVQQMRLLAGRIGERPPSDAELETFYDRHRDEYRMPDRLSFWHVFVSSEPHGGGMPARAADVLAEIRRGDVPPAVAARRGDAFALAPHVVGRSATQIAAVFGPAFAERVRTEETGRWIGPVRSPYGLHLVWIESRAAGAPPPLEAVRGRVTERWLEEQRTARVAALVRELRSRYPVEVASTAWRDRSRS